MVFIIMIHSMNAIIEKSHNKKLQYLIPLLNP